MLDLSNPTLFMIKKRVYVIALLTALGAYATEILLSWYSSGLASKDIFVWFPLWLLTLYSVIFLLRTKKIYRPLEMVFYSLVSFDIVHGYAEGLLFGSATNSVMSGIWLAFVYAFAFFVFEPRRALSICLGVVLPLTAVGVYSYLVRDLPFDVLVGIVRVHFASSQVILFGYAASRWREAYVKKQVEAEISEHQALTDALTGVMNRRALEGTLEREMSKASRYQRPLSLVLFDLDHFKTINDSYGHARGDVVLKTLTHLTELNLRLEDNLGRWGGEEFVLICSETTLEEAAEVAERLRLVIAEHPWDMPVSASFGVAQWQAGETLARFFERADQALYAAKQAGRNTVRTLVPTEQLGSVASNIALI